MSGSVLMTGGSGQLGTALRLLEPRILAPPRSELDITSPASIAAAIGKYQPELLIHAAAYTDVAAAETDRQRCWKINVDGTRNVVHAVNKANIFLVYISTDYVFDGRVGGYREDSPLGPVQNYYSLTKLVAETLVRLSLRHIVIRTSFRPNTWPYQVAFTDVYTSQDYVDVIAPQIMLAVRNYRRVPYDTLHIGTERKSVYELARRRKPDVQPGTKAQANVNLPDDVSLDSSRWRQLKQDWNLT